MSTELICAAVAIIALLKGLAIGWFAGLQRGLYLGEKGRRQSAESLLVLGVPEAPPAKRMTIGNAGVPIEPTSAPAGFDRATIKRGARIIQDEARAMGAPVPNEDQAEALANQMLTTSMYGGGDDDIAIPGR